MGPSEWLSVVMPAWIDTTFPRLAQEGYDITSNPDRTYNCVAWAAGDTTTWWQHFPGYRWPATRGQHINSLVEVFESLGYEVCKDDTLEAGYDKIAVYAKKQQWQHAAHQHRNGRWTSKLGPDEGIAHDNPYSMCGDLYGYEGTIMRRQKDV